MHFSLGTYRTDGILHCNSTNRLSQRQSPTPSEDRQTLLSRLRAFEWSRSLNRWIQNERSGSDEVDQDQDVENQNNRSETNISFSNPGFNRVSNSNE